MNDVVAADFSLQTTRLRLRPMEMGDEDLFCSLYTDAQTMRYIGPAFTPEHAAQRFRQTLGLMYQQPMQWLFLTILHRFTFQPLGICGIPEFDTRANRLEVGILLRPEGRSQGFGTEALQGLADKAFEKLCISEIWVEFSSQDTIMQRISSTIGFTPGVGLFAIDQGSSSRRIWTVHRSAWCVNGSINEGDYNVERRQFS
jgi:RimJ/RimL family protein N-acetyltransferase